jgi:hypothetical protein
MTPARQRRSSGPAEAPKIQDRPAAPAKKKAPEPPASGDFPPNPVVPVKAGPEQPTERTLRVTGPREVGGVAPGGRVVMTLTDGQYEALRRSHHVEPWTEQDDQPVSGLEKGN